MNIVNLILLSVVFLLISSCSFTPKKDDTQCVYADGSNRPAPDWVCNKGTHKKCLSAVAYADKSAAGKSFMKQMAENAARRKLSQHLETKINNMIKQYAKEEGLENHNNIKQVLRQTKKLISHESLKAAYVVQQRITPTGGMALMLMMDEKKTLKSCKEIIQSSIKKHPKLWQELQKKHAKDSLLEAILKQH